MNCTHLTQEERYQIYAFKKAGVKPGKIAEVLERSGSTISRELSRNRGKRGYRPKQAQTLSEARWALNARRIDEATWTFAQERLLEQWSPEQISGHAAISPETVYQRIYADKRAGGALWKNLRCQKQRRKRYGKVERRGTIPNRLSIEEGPAIVETRSRIGDWEADTVIGRNHRQTMIGLLKPHRKKVHTITSDNGREFAGH